MFRASPRPMRTRHRLPVALGLVSLLVLLAACGPTTDSAAPDPVAPDAGSSPAVTSPPSDGPDATGAPDGLGTLLVGISVHVEGWTGEANDPATFARHRDAILSLARTASGAGAVLTFELSPSFIGGARAYDPDVVDELEALGHEVALHADVGGQGTPTLDEMVAALVSMRGALTALGADPTHVSGICSRGPWVEAALAAGFTSTSGAVAYCATSMDPALLAEDQAWVLDCADPLACHGAAPVDEWHQWNPFMSDSSRDWMQADDPSGLVIVVGASGGGIPCPDGFAHDAPAGTSCTPDDGDPAAVAAVLEEAIAARVAGETHALTFSWSIGTIPPEGYAEAVFAVFGAAVADGHAAWAGLGAIAATATTDAR